MHEAFTRSTRQTWTQEPRSETEEARGEEEVGRDGTRGKEMLAEDHGHRQFDSTAVLSSPGRDSLEKAALI
jgi:hypothetical protein